MVSTCPIGGHHRCRFRYRPQDDLAGRILLASEKSSRPLPSRSAAATDARPQWLLPAATVLLLFALMMFTVNRVTFIGMVVGDRAEPVFRHGQSIVVDRVSFKLFPYKPGEVVGVLFKPGDDQSRALMRVVLGTSSTAVICGEPMSTARDELLIQRFVSDCDVCRGNYAFVKLSQVDGRVIARLRPTFELFPGRVGETEYQESPLEHSDRRPSA